MDSTDLIALKCVISSTDINVPLGMRVCVDDKVLYENSHVKDEEIVEYKISDNDNEEHTLTFELFGKLPAHTKINDAGEILQDALISIKNLEIDGIDISQVLQDSAIYYHDFNGSKDPVEDKFNGAIGCNGIVKLKFTTPFYLWLLENM